MPKRIRGDWAPSLPFTHRTYRPYVIALGEAALAWNDLHASLSMLFCGVMGGGYVNQFLAVWQNIPSDRAQREVLKAATLGYTGTEAPLNKGLRESVEFICNEATKIEDFRNDALHSPLFASKGGPVTPMTGLGHIRAKKLSCGPELLGEFRWFRDRATILRNFTMEIDHALASGVGQPWPKMPKLPPRPTKKARAGA